MVPQCIEYLLDTLEKLNDTGWNRTTTSMYSLPNCAGGQPIQLSDAYHCTIGPCLIPNKIDTKRTPRAHRRPALLKMLMSIIEKHHGAHQA